MHHGDLPTASTPTTLRRTILFQPIMTDQLNIIVQEGASEIQGRIELVGLPSKKVYHANPIFEKQHFQTGKYVKLKYLSTSLSAIFMRNRSATISICQVHVAQFLREIKVHQ